MMTDHDFPSLLFIFQSRHVLRSEIPSVVFILSKIIENLTLEICFVFYYLLQSCTNRRHVMLTLDRMR